MILTQRFQAAITYGIKLHFGQYRKGTDIPYVSHLLAVASLVMEHGGNEDEVIAALLHDAVEDQGGEATLQEIRLQYGDQVADIVAGCTDAWVIPKPPWRVRKEGYIKHLGEASSSILLVSSADKLHNARRILGDYRKIGEELWSRFSGGKAGILWYYRTITDTYKGLIAPTDIVTELDRVVSQIEQLAQYKTE